MYGRTALCLCVVCVAEVVQFSWGDQVINATGLCSHHSKLHKLGLIFTAYALSVVKRILCSKHWLPAAVQFVTVLTAGLPYDSCLWW